MQFAANQPKVICVVVLLVIVVVVIVGGCIAYFSWQMEKKRRAEWEAWAAERGWQYSYEKDHSLADSFDFLNRLRQGKNRYAKDVFRGSWQGTPFFIFNFHYETTRRDSDGNRKTSHHWIEVIAVQVASGSTFFPELRIAPENAFKRFAHAITGSDIDFESIEFSKKFEVKSTNKRFAYDFCHSKTIEYLLQYPSTQFELEGQWMAITNNGKLKLENIDPQLAHLHNLRSLMPPHMFQM